MGCDPAALRRASQRLERRRKIRQEQQDALRRKLFKQIPELSDIDRQLRGSVLDAITGSLRSSTDPRAALEVLKNKNLSLQQRQRQLLREAGYSPDVLDDAPVCKVCGDTGWVGTTMCQCLKTLCIQEQVDELDQLLDFNKHNFDNFSLEKYSPDPWKEKPRTPRKTMEFIRDYCGNYATKFGRQAEKNLFLIGDPGLGKTFLSACIAKVVAENGFWVVYETAVELFARFEEQKFSRDVQEGREAQNETRRYLSCDLLILDDLGSELTTPFVQSALYTLVNTRLTTNKATVISTNLTMDGVRERYSGQIASRLEGEYKTLLFYGDDIRLKGSAGN